LSHYFKEIVQFLVKNASREDHTGSGVDLTQASYVALTSLVEHSCPASDGVVLALLEEVLKILESTLDQETMGI
jgi:hypothetical protein